MGVAAAEWVRPFEGEHVAQLQWLTELPGSPSAQPIALTDTVTIDVHYEGELGMFHSCGPSFDVPVSVDVHTDVSALDDSAQGELTFQDGPLVSLHVQGRVLSLYARFSQVEGAAPEGELVPNVAGTPGPAAELMALPSKAEGENR